MVKSSLVCFGVIALKPNMDADNALKEIELGKLDKIFWYWDKSKAPLLRDKMFFP
jgi:hypothetical protein